MESVCYHTHEKGLKTKILLNNSYVTNMNRASSGPLLESGILYPSIVAIQWPCGYQAISQCLSDSHTSDIWITDNIDMFEYLDVYLLVLLFDYVQTSVSLVHFVLCLLK